MSQAVEVEMGKPGILVVRIKKQEPGCKVERRDRNFSQYRWTVYLPDGHRDISLRTLNKDFQSNVGD